MKGFGAAPLGSAPAGFGLPETAARALGGPLEDETGMVQSGRYLDPLTKQYRFNALGRVAGMAEVPQLVQLAFATLRGSSAFASLGLDLLSLEEFTDNFQLRAQSMIADAVAHLAGLVAVASVAIQRFGESGARFTVRWVDLTTGIAQSTDI